jgi:hypothetical protein
MEIKRGYSRKINLGNYESEDIWGSRSIDVPPETTIEEAQKISKDLFTLAMTDVERDKRTLEKLRDEDGTISSEKLKEMLDNVANGKPLLIEDFEKLNPVQNGKIQDVKKERKRKEYAEKKNGN